MAFSSFLAAFLISLSAAGPAVPLPPQPQVSETRAALAGSRGKRWTFEKFDKYLGQENRCTKGETWTFLPNETLDVARCVENKVVRRETKFALRAKSDQDVALTVDGAEYLVIFPARSAGSKREELILRQRAESTTQETVDRVFFRTRD